MTEADRLLVDAALDGEMDSLTLAAFERRLTQEPDLARAYAQAQALRGALRNMPAARAPDALRRKIEAMAAPVVSVAPVAARPRTPGWGSLAATIAALGVGLAVGFTSAPRENVDREILAGHLRGMISTHPVDVASTDQHTVKPWFAGKLAVAPVVVDLAAQGFPLEGGRIDIVAGEAAPTLVYRAGKHVISVTRLPAAAPSPVAAASSRHEIEGHTLLRWSENGVSYVAASDASAAEVETFAAAFRKASAAAN
jgi:anti-sigma factor RsiW